MSRITRALLPPFLRRLDRQLLLNRPGLWATRIHYMAFYGSIGAALLLAQAWLMPVSPSQVPDPGLWAGLSVVPLALGLGWWVYHLGFFRRSAQYGQDDTFGNLRDQLLYAGVILGLAALPVLYGHVLRHRVANLTDPETLIADINVLNIGETLLNQSGFFVHHQQSYIEYGQRARYQAHYLGLQDRQALLHRTWEPVEQVAHLEAYRQVLAKYSGEALPFRGEALLNRHFQQTDILGTHLSYPMRRQVDRRVTRLYEAQVETFGWEARAFRHLWVIGVFGLWLALQLFQRSGWRIFIHSAFAGAAMVFLAGLVAMVANGAFRIEGPEPFFFTMLLLYLGLFTQAYRAQNNRRTRHWKLMSLTLVTLLTPFFPFMMLMVSDHRPTEQMAWNALFLGLGLGLAVWEMLLAPRLRVLLASPQDN